MASLKAKTAGSVLPSPPGAPYLVSPKSYDKHYENRNDMSYDKKERTLMMMMVTKTTIANDDDL